MVRDGFEVIKLPKHTQIHTNSYKHTHTQTYIHTHTHNTTQHIRKHTSRKSLSLADSVVIGHTNHTAYGPLE